VTHPTGNTLLQGRPYRPACATDVRETWKRFGWTPRPRFACVTCSQCGWAFGPGDNGFSSCGEHAGLRPVED
jgi:hypothetical protein